MAAIHLQVRLVNLGRSRLSRAIKCVAGRRKVTTVLCRGKLLECGCLSSANPVLDRVFLPPKTAGSNPSQSN